MNDPPLSSGEDPSRVFRRTPPGLEQMKDLRLRVEALEARHRLRHTTNNHKENA